MKFGILSDLHLGPRTVRHGRWGKACDAGLPLLEAIRDEFAAERVDAVINLGDLIEEDREAADLERLTHAKAILDTIGAPVYHLLGNHDHELLKPVRALDAVGGERGIVFSLGPLTGIALTLSCEPGGKNIEFGADMLRFLERAISRPGPKVLFTHYPVIETSLEGNDWFEGHPEYAFPRDSRAALEIVADAESFVGIIHGHLHATRFAALDGIEQLGIGSVTETFGCESGAQNVRAVADWDGTSLTVDVRGRNPERFVFGGGVPR